MATTTTTPIHRSLTIRQMKRRLKKKEAPARPKPPPIRIIQVRGYDDPMRRHRLPSDLVSPTFTQDRRIRHAAQELEETDKAQARPLVQGYKGHSVALLARQLKEKKRADALAAVRGKVEIHQRNALKSAAKKRRAARKLARKSGGGSVGVGAQGSFRVRRKSTSRKQSRRRSSAFSETKPKVVRRRSSARVEIRVGPNQTVESVVEVGGDSPRKRGKASPRTGGGVSTLGSIADVPGTVPS